MLMMIAALLALAGWAAPALAHPHVWVTVRAELIFDGSGRVAAIRHHWTFDEAYSSFAIQGLDKNGDGKYGRDELAELAKINTESLAEFGFFTTLKIDGKRVAFDAPRDPALDHDGKMLTLQYLLPVKDPVANKRTIILDVADPTWFVDFGYDDGDNPVVLEGGGNGCAVQVSRPKKPDLAQQKLSEDYFANANMGLQYASKVIVACP